MNIADCIVVAILVLAVVMAIVSIRRQRKNGSGCHGACGSCQCNCSHRPENGEK